MEEHNNPKETEKPMTTLERQKYQVSLEERRFFGHKGYLKVESLLTDAELSELDQHSMNLALDKVDLDHLEGVEPPAATDERSPAAAEDRYFRFIQFHRHLEIHERFLLHPRVLDVLEVLIGPDLMAMQSMLFLKPPGQPGQAFHQDSYYIKTAPDTWIAIDDCDEENGCMSFIPGTNLDPIYHEVTQPENTRDFKAGLTEIAGVETSREILAEARAGEVIFFPTATSSIARTRTAARTACAAPTSATTPTLAPTPSGATATPATSWPGAQPTCPLPEPVSSTTPPNL